MLVPLWIGRWRESVDLKELSEFRTAKLPAYFSASCRTKICNLLMTYENSMIICGRSLCLVDVNFWVNDPFSYWYKAANNQRAVRTLERVRIYSSVIFGSFIDRALSRFDGIRKLFATAFTCAV